MGSASSRPSCVIRKDSQLPTSLLVRSSPETGHLQRREGVTSRVTPGRPLAWLAPAWPAEPPQSSLGALWHRGAEGQGVQGSPGLPSPRTSHCSPGSCKALRFQDSTRPPGCFGLRTDESVSAAAPDAINKELATDKCSEAVNALCICSAFKICAWPVVTALTLGPRACRRPTACRPPPLAAQLQLLGQSSPRAPQGPGLGRHVPPLQPSDLDLPH